MTETDRLNIAENKIKKQWFNRKKYIEINKGISTATASRDLKSGLESKRLESRGQQRKTEYQFK